MNAETQCFSPCFMFVFISMMIFNMMLQYKNNAPKNKNLKT